jgi:hypothetical protein
MKNIIKKVSLILIASMLIITLGACYLDSQSNTNETISVNLAEVEVAEPEEERNSVHSIVWEYSDRLKHECDDAICVGDTIQILQPYDIHSVVYKDLYGWIYNYYDIVDGETHIRNHDENLIATSAGSVTIVFYQASLDPPTYDETGAFIDPGYVESASLTFTIVEANNN